MSDLRLILENEKSAKTLTTIIYALYAASFLSASPPSWRL